MLAMERNLQVADGLTLEQRQKAVMRGSKDFHLLGRDPDYG